ncbi:MAG: hypothetical protein ACYTG3_01250 [Planctomycetota bacterium]|jgi:hypothetical protein
MRRAIALLLASLMLADTVLLTTTVHAQSDDDAPPDSPWPQELEKKGARIIVYQPQTETFDGDRLTGRAAVSVTPPNETEPRFGAIWVEARVSTDRDARTVELLELKIPRVRFPSAPEDKQKKLVELLEKEMPTWAPQISLDRLLTSLDTAEVKKKEAANLKTDPPKIIFATEPTELVILDGKPELRPVESSTCMKVINTRFLILLEPTTKAYYLSLGKVWMTAPDLLKGPWTHAKQPPAEVSKLTPKMDEDEAKEDEGLVPKVLVVNEPTELITTDGKPNYTPLAGNELLYVANTDASVLMELATQTHYALVSGRWYRSKSFDGPWAYVAADKLPQSFAKIPADSEVGDVRASVAGTDEAKDAVMDAQIPQTATIKRVAPDFKVTYDGDPKFAAIEGSKLAYALNSKFTVIQDSSGEKRKYYCCHEAVWYESPGPAGPWAVCIQVPAEIYAIPPSCPVYNVTYVRVYGYTSEVVYVGYLPGYHGCYVYNGTVVYGTGYTYVVWVGTVYYPRPVTYGYGYRYSPLGRWFSPWSIGGVVRRTRRRTRRRHRRHYNNHRHHHHHHRNSYSRNRNSNRYRSGGSKSPARTQANRNSARNKSTGRKNNHYADKNGNVSRRNNNGSWQQKNKSGWSQSNKGSSAQNRNHNNRQRGSSRSQSNRSRGGGGRGGGGRRR